MVSSIPPRLVAAASLRSPAAVLTVALIVGLSVSGARAAGENAPPEELLAAVEVRYASLQTLVASFRQTYRSAALGQTVEERGRLTVKRPGSMRWDTTRPERKVFLVEVDAADSSEATTLSYIPADLTAVRGRVAIAEAPHLQLLLGRGHLGNSFAVSDVRLKTARDPSSRQLRLLPRRRLAHVEVAYLEIDPEALTVSRVLVVDALGNESDLVLERVREDARVRDSTFDPRLPSGVTVRGAAVAAGDR